MNYNLYNFSDSIVVKAANGNEARINAYRHKRRGCCRATLYTEEAGRSFEYTETVESWQNRPWGDPVENVIKKAIRKIEDPELREEALKQYEARTSEKRQKEAERLDKICGTLESLTAGQKKALSGYEVTPENVEDFEKVVNLTAAFNAILG